MSSDPTSTDSTSTDSTSTDSTSTEPPESVKLVVDADKCIGSGMCEMLEEATFLIDEDTNIAAVTGDGALPPDRAEIVIDRCPAGAISIRPSSLHPSQD